VAVRIRRKFRAAARSTGRYDGLEPGIAPSGSQPLAEKGRIAAELLFGRREGSSIVLPTRLVVRASTAPPAPGRGR
jgi:hypothetical protein